MRIHHRFLDGQKHLPPKRVTLNEKLIYNYVIHVIIHSNVENLSNLYLIDLRLQQILRVTNKCDSLDVRIHQRFWDAQKHLPPKRVTLKEKLIYNYVIHVTIHSNVENLSNLYPIDLRLQQILPVTYKCRFIRCENSSQILGCSTTSISETCYSEGKAYLQLCNICDYSFKC